MNRYDLLDPQVAVLLVAAERAEPWMRVLSQIRTRLERVAAVLVYAT